MAGGKGAEGRHVKADEFRQYAEERWAGPRQQDKTEAILISLARLGTGGSQEHPAARHGQAA